MEKMALSLLPPGFKALGDLFMQETLRQWGVRDKINLLRDELQAIECFLLDVSCTQNLDERAKNWMREARDVAYEVEDLIDRVILMIDAYNNSHVRNKSGLQVVERHKMSTKIDLLVDKLRKIADHRNTYDVSIFGGNTGQGVGNSDQFQVWRHSGPQPKDDPTLSFVQMNDDVKKIIVRLKLNDHVESLGVIPIVGMGGIGKTTLATVIYRKATSLSDAPPLSGKVLTSTDDIGIQFDTCAWLTVTQNYQIEHLLRRLITLVNKPSTGMELEKMEYPELVQLLYDSLTGKKYLIVIDDVWATEVWDRIVVALPERNKGGHVILTTRSIEVARHANPEPHRVPLFTDEQSWNLFCRRVFNGSNCPSELKVLGEELSKKCGGLPLALVILGGLLSTKSRNPATWAKLLATLNWESRTIGGKQCMEILSLSYNDLPYYVKVCFLYLAAFPAGRIIPASKLIELWIADGLIMQQGEETMEEVAECYLEELIQRCLVQVVKRRPNEYAKTILIHDILRKLSVMKAREDYFLRVERIPHSGVITETESKAGKDVWRLALHEDLMPQFHLRTSRRLRALLVFPKKDTSTGNPTLQQLEVPCHPDSSKKRPYLFGSKAKYLRLLELEDMKGLLLEDKVKLERLQLLRYLGLRDTDLKTIPASVGKLRNLLTLNLRGTGIKELPEEFWELKLLRHLYLNSEVCPDKIGNFTKLQVLQQAKCGDWVNDLAKLTDLRKLGIEGVGEFNWDTLVVELKKLSHLASLKLSGTAIPPLNVFEAVSGHDQLHELKLKGNISGERLPASVRFPPHLMKLVLESSMLEEDPMPVLEKLSSLRILKFKSEVCVHNIMICSAGGFLSLRSFKMNGMLWLLDWEVAAGAMSSLTHLSIGNCHYLKTIPLELLKSTSLQKLELSSLRSMPAKFLEKLASTRDVNWNGIEIVPEDTAIRLRNSLQSAAAST